MKHLWKHLLAALLCATCSAQDADPFADPFADVPDPLPDAGLDALKRVPSLENRMRTWLVPEASFEHASLNDVMDFIRTISRKVDPEKKGVNIIQTRSTQGAPPITLSLKNVSVRDLIEYTCTVADVDFRIGGNAVVIDKIPPMITHTYSVDPTLFSERIPLGMGPGGFDDDDEGGVGDDGGSFDDFDAPNVVADGVSLKAVFNAYGVPFPAGSSITYEPVISQLIVRNTEENLKIFERILDTINIQPRQVEISGAFVTFTLAELAMIPDLVLPELASTAQLVALRESGAGIGAPFRVVTINGVNAVVEDVEEIIYPTEFDVSEGDIKRIAVIPGAFETREVGQILNVTPIVSPDNHTINLTLLPEQAALVREIDYGFDYTDEKGNLMHVPMRQPVFHSRNLTTSITIYNGSTLVVGGGYDEANKVMGYIFITARLIKPDAKPIVVGEKK
ncbi:MAG: hypothetical protein ACI9TH_002615 [Kiritimatiellia bacterium]|jgi:hypothetical protein